MDIKKYFEYSPILDLTAAHIGINRWNWISIPSHEDEDEALSMMKANRFDVLPIETENGDVNSFYATRTWNEYSGLNKNQIIDSDKIYYRTSFEDLISRFYAEKRHFYFLSNHNQILGLVSFVNINSQPVYNYLFQLIAELEMKLVNLLSAVLNHDEVIDDFNNSSDEHLIHVLQSYQNTAENGSDNTIFHHMYLQTLGITMRHFQDSLPSNYKPLLAYRKKFAANGLFTKIRNTVMHPVKPVLNDSVSIKDLNEFLNDYGSISDLIRNI